MQSCSHGCVRAKSGPIWSSRLRWCGQSIQAQGDAMFTGIIEDVGEVSRVSATELVIDTNLADIVKGESVAINGTCLTAREVLIRGKTHVVKFDFSPETRA